MRPASVDARRREGCGAALRVPFDEEASAAAADAGGCCDRCSADGWAWVRLVEAMRLSLSRVETTRRGSAPARWISHALLSLSLTVVALSVPMILTAFGSPLVFAACLPVLLGVRGFPTAVAAIALPAEAAVAYAEHHAAQEADSTKERDACCRHRSRKAGVDGEIGLWDAQSVTV